MEALVKPSELVASRLPMAQIQQPTFLWRPPGVGKSQVAALA